MADASGRDMWIEAGLKEIGQGGVERVRVEVLAERLGITKGGFYRRFKDRRALLDALLSG
jgi:AcrR family transcriptional regulator